MRVRLLLLGWGVTVKLAEASMGDGKNPASACIKWCPGWERGILKTKLNVPLVLVMNPTNWSSKLSSTVIGYSGLGGLVGIENPEPWTSTMVPIGPLDGVTTKTGGGRMVTWPPVRWLLDGFWSVERKTVAESV